MKPIKVKAYGLLNFTKKQYTITQLIVFAFLVTLFLLSFLYNFDKFMLSNAKILNNFDKFMLGNAKILILVVAFLESIETFFMFKKFKEKETTTKNK